MGHVATCPGTCTQAIRHLSDTVQGRWSMREFAWGLVPCSHPTLRSAEYVLGMRGPRVFSLLGVVHSSRGGTRGEPPSTFFFRRHEMHSAAWSRNACTITPRVHYVLERSSWGTYVRRRHLAALACRAAKHLCAFCVTRKHKKHKNVLCLFRRHEMHSAAWSCNTCTSATGSHHAL